VNSRTVLTFFTRYCKNCHQNMNKIMDALMHIMKHVNSTEWNLVVTLS